MKSKLFLTLAVLVASNAFIATPTMAFDWKKAALATGKTAFGASVLGASVLICSLPVLGTVIAIKEKDHQLQPIPLALATLALAVFITGATSGYIGCKALKSAWNDHKIMCLATAAVVASYAGYDLSRDRLIKH